MSSAGQFDHERRRQIYEYVERNGAVDPEVARQDVLVRPDSESKPARSAAELEPSVPMPSEEFDHHVAILERDGYLEERDGKLRVVHPGEADARTVELDGLEATVRPARQEDGDDIVAVIEAVATADTHVVAARLADELRRDEALLRHNEREDRVFFVATVDAGERCSSTPDSNARRDGDVVGWLHVEGVRFPYMDHTTELTVGVLDRYRGDGLGSALMESGLEWARERGYRKIYQNLPATNDGAVSFLEDHGWSVESTREGHYRIDDELVDEVQLAVWIDE